MPERPLPKAADCRKVLSSRRNLLGSGIYEEGSQCALTHMRKEQWVEEGRGIHCLNTCHNSGHQLTDYSSIRFCPLFSKCTLPISLTLGVPRTEQIEERWRATKAKEETKSPFPSGSCSYSLSRRGSQKLLIG